MCSSDLVLGAVSTFLNGLTAGALISPTEWPAERQLSQLRIQLELWRVWARNAVPVQSRSKTVRRVTRPRAAGL